MENQPSFGPNPNQPVAPRVNSDDKTMALLAHLGGVFFGFLPSLIIWLIKKDESPYVDMQAKEALNFQIFIAICCIISLILMIVIIGVFLLILVSLANLIFCIVAAVKASNGELYRYPISIRLIK